MYYLPGFRAGLRDSLLLGYSRVHRAVNQAPTAMAAHIHEVKLEVAITAGTFLTLI